MVRILRAAALAGALVLSASAADAQQAAPQKFAYINSQAILAEAPGRAEAEAQFEREMAQFRQQVTRMGDSLNVLVTAYSKDEPTLSPAAKETRAKAIQEREVAYQQRARQLEQQAAKRQQELVQPILDRVTAILAEIREEEGYAFIFDAQSGANVIVAADKNLDITQRVLARLKAQPAAAPKRPTGAPLNAAPAGVTRPKNP